MKTFIVGSRDRVRVIGDAEDVVFISSSQYTAAQTISRFGHSLGLTNEEFADLLDHLGSGLVLHETINSIPVQQVVAKPAQPWVDTDSMTWQQIADLGPDYKIRAITKLRGTDASYRGLKEARDRVEEYMAQ